MTKTEIKEYLHKLENKLLIKSKKNSIELPPTAKRKPPRSETRGSSNGGIFTELGFSNLCSCGSLLPAAD
jgi:hypothetical protein